MDKNKDEAVPPDSSLLRRAFEEKDRSQLKELLEDSIRRQVLYDIQLGDDEVRLSELAESVANPDVRGGGGHETLPSRPDDDTTEAERIAIQLHHVHLPKLADHGLVEYDHRTQVVVPKSP